MKKIFSLIVIYTTQFALATHTPDTLEGVWTDDGPFEREISFCEGVSTWELLVEDGAFVPVTVPYEIVGGNSRLFILKLQLSDVEDSVFDIHTNGKGIRVEPMDCKSSPEKCKANAIASYRRLLNQHPDVGVDRFIQGIKDIDFSAIEVQSSSYTFSRACGSQN